MTEKDLQIAVVEHLFWYETQRKILFFFMVANGVLMGGANIAKYINSLRKQGFRNGVSDLIIVMENRVIFLELKTPKGKISEYQDIFKNKILPCQVAEYVILRNINELDGIINKGKK